MTKNNPWTKKANTESVDLTKLDEIYIPGEVSAPKPKKIAKTYDTQFTARLTKATHNKIMHIKNHPNPDIKRSLGVIIEQAVDLYLLDKEIEL